MSDQSAEDHWPMRPRYTPDRVADARPPEDRFEGAARAALSTPLDQRERDLAGVIGQLETTAGAKDSPERAAFQKDQAERSDQISREADPDKRAELRQEREAQGHLYAAHLADQIGGKVLSVGQIENATAMLEYANLQREIAGELRSPTGPERPEIAGELRSPTGPERPGPPMEREPMPSGREQFARAAEAVGREFLGASAETVMVAEGPNGDQARENMLRLHIRPETVNDFGRQTRTATATDRPRAADQEEPAGRQEAGIDQEAAGRDERAAYTRAQIGAETQRAEEAALHGGTAQPTSAAEVDAMIRDTLAKFTKEAEAERAAEGPQQESGQGLSRASGRYATLGL